MMAVGPASCARWHDSTVRNLSSHTARALTTSNGIIIIDTLYQRSECRVQSPSVYRL
jgi:hypothetical protein